MVLEQGELVLFGSAGGNWWDLFCGGKKVGKQCGKFVHGKYLCTFVDPKLLALFVNSNFVPIESDQSRRNSRFLEESWKVPDGSIINWMSEEQEKYKISDV